MALFSVNLFTSLLHENGNSKIYHSDDMIKFAQRAGLKISNIHDGLGVGHTLLCCERS